MEDFVGASIARFCALLPFIPRAHPLRPCALAALGSGLFYRYVISHQRDDLNALIPLLTEALLLPLGPLAPHSFHTTIFNKLSCSLAIRFELARDPVDLEHAIKYYRYLLTLPLRTIVEIDVLEVLANFVKLIHHRMMVQSEVVPRSDTAEEIIDFLQKFISVDPSSQHVESIMQSLGLILLSRITENYERGECDHVVKLFAKIEKLCPPERFPDFCVIQGIAFSLLFQQTSLNEHCRQANVRFNKALALLPPEHNMRPLAQMGLATILHHSFTHDKQLKSLEEAIDYSRAALSACPHGHPLRPACLTLLAGSLRWRHEFFGNADFMREADSCIDDALSQDVPEELRVAVANAIDESNTFIGGFRGDNSSLEALTEEIERQKERLAKMAPDQSDQLDVLRSIAQTCGAKFNRTGELADLDEEIKYHSMALAASPPDHYVRRMSLFSLGEAFQKWALFGNDVNSLEESIKCCREALELSPRGQLSRFEPLHTLAISLNLRFMMFHRSADLDESMAQFHTAFDEAYVNPHSKCQIASHWATFARVHRHPSTALAYERAMSLMHTSLVLGPTLEVQHRLLRRNWTTLATVPHECASYYIEEGSLEKAVESLERGRGLLWSEMRGLRVPIDQQLRTSKNARLADRFVAVSRELEDVTTTCAEASPSATECSRGRTSPDDHQQPDWFGRMVERARTLERERGEIIEQIRYLPGLKNFLKAIPFETLQTAAAGGPVIIVNHCRFRCDILLILHHSAPILIPTAEGFYTRTMKLKEELLDTRARYALESRQYQRSLRFVLSELYALVGRPVMEKLGELGIPEQSRVWWCPTSAICSLPLHAAGPIESEDGIKRYFSDVYVSSYTPTLSALIESREKNLRDDALVTPSLLIIGQPDLSLPGVRDELEVIHRLVQSATSLIGAKATRSTVMKQLTNHRMVHFACHGSLELNRPFETAFLLRGETGGEERLSLLDIVRSRLSGAEFAFLSVCHAAEWTDEKIPDEALHLTAAMQYCGFRSVVGTLWAMDDKDGRDLSEHFYKRMFAEEERATPIGERSARALQGAVQRLRRKRGMRLERWVNFVHYGA